MHSFMIGTGDLLQGSRLLLRKPYAEILFDEENRIIVARWIGDLEVHNVRDGCEFMIDFIKINAVVKHLSDHTELKVLSPEVQEYLVTTWFFEVERVGLRKVAVRVAKDIFTQATVRSVNRKEKYGGLEIEAFPSFEEARQWLLS